MYIGVNKAKSLHCVFGCTKLDSTCINSATANAGLTPFSGSEACAFFPLRLILILCTVAVK